MPAIVTAPPFGVELAGVAGYDENQFGDSLVKDTVNGDLYQTLSYFPTSPFVALHTGIFKSTDRGQTWTLLLDAATRAPGWIYYEPSNRTIYYVTGSVGLGYVVRNYSLDTGAGTPTANTGVITNSGGFPTVVYQAATTTLYLIFPRNDPAGNATISYTANSGAGWGAVTEAQNDGATGGAGNVDRMIAARADSTGLIRVAYVNLNNTGPVNTVKSFSISTGGVVSAAGTVETLTNANDFTGSTEGRILFQGSTVFLGYCPTTDAPHVAIGAGLAVPVWTVTIPAPAFNPVTDIDNYIDLALDSSGTVTMFYVKSVQPAAFTNQTINLVPYAGANAWDTPQLYYDYINNPPAPADNPVDPTLAAMQGVRAVAYNAGWVGTSNLFVVTTGGNFPAGFAFPGPAAPNLPTTTPGDGGRKTVVLTPNQFDFCLHREYRLFCNIDYDAKGCARLPKCFTVDEREWGGAG